jgi:hypothetical protein
MANEEILTGLNNALTRGQSIQAAIQSLINSGYPPQEVYETSRYAGMGITSELSSIQRRTEENNYQNDYKKLPVSSKENNSLYPSSEKKESKKISTWVIVLIITFLVLLVLLGIFIWKGEAIINSLFS